MIGAGFLALVLAAVALLVQVQRLRRSGAEVARLALVARYSASCVALADSQGRIQWVNEAFTRQTGWSLADVSLWRVCQLLEGGHAEGCPASPLQEAVQGGREFRGELRCRRAEGAPFWAEVELIPTRGEAGADEEFIVALHDTDARHKAAVEVAESEARFRSTLDALTEGIVVQGLDGAIQLVNPAAERILGLTPGQLAGRTSMDPRWRAIHEDGSDYPGSEHPSMTTLRTREPVSGAIMGVHRPSGELAWISIETGLLSGAESGEPTGVVSVFADVTARRRAEAEIATLYQAVEQSSVMCVITDAEARIEYVNPCFERITGWSLGEVRGQNPRLLGAGTTPPEIFRDMWATLNSGSTWRGELINRRRDGAPFLSRISVFPLRDAGGRVTNYVASSEDVTQERLHAQELARANEAALAAARAKDQFLQNMSHELRTPMNGILGMAELLLEGELTAEQKSDLVTLRASADKLLTVISHLFDFTSTGVAEAAAARVPFRLRGCIREVQRRFAADAEARGLQWRVEVAGDVPELLQGDPGGLRQVLLNLADNAVKFTERGRVELHVVAEAIESTSARLRFEVRDTGIGIEPDRQAGIFEAFAQADGSSTRRYGGLGLGLTLARRIVQRMHGQLELRSEPGEGSTFSFVLTLPRADAGVTEPTGCEPAPPLPRATLLLVDGGTSARTHAGEALERTGARVDVVPGVEAAIAVLAEERREGRAPGVLVLDQRAGGLDAFAAARRLRETFGSDIPPMLLLTSVGQRGDAERCRELGIAAYLTQPCSDPDLEEAITHLLNGPASAPGGALVTRHSIREAHRPVRVLLVEDNAVNRKVATRLLERSGFEVSVAVDGSEGANAFRSGGWDVVLMDIQMPVMDGLESTRAIRAWELEQGLARTPIIAVTAHTMDADRAAVAEAGMDGFVSKPIQADDLFRMIRSRVRSAPGEADENVAPAGLREVLDWDEALERMDGDELVLRELLRLFLQDSAGMMERLDEARASGDAKRIERAAHSLKGASATISARAVAPIAQEVEALAREGQSALALERLVELRVALLRLTRAIEALPEEPEQRRAAA